MKVTARILVMLVVFLFSMFPGACAKEEPAGPKIQEIKNRGTLIISAKKQNHLPAGTGMWHIFRNETLKSV